MKRDALRKILAESARVRAVRDLGSLEKSVDLSPEQSLVKAALANGFEIKKVRPSNRPPDLRSRPRGY